MTTHPDHLKQPARRVTPATWRLALALALAGLFGAALLTAYLSPHLHIWFSSGLAGAISLHLVGHRRWMLAIGRRLLQPMPLRARLQGLTNLALVIVWLLLTASGVIVALIYAPAMVHIHTIASHLLIGLIGLHLALNARWIAAQARRRLARRPAQT